MKPAEKRSRRGVNYAELRSDQNRLIKDDSQGKDWEELVRGRGLHHLSSGLSVICQRPITHTPQMFEGLHFTSRLQEEGRGGGKAASGIPAARASRPCPNVLCETIPTPVHTRLLVPEKELFLVSTSG